MKKRILVAEDSIIVNRHISQVLVNSGYEVMSAFSGAEAVEKAKSNAPDIILMDIMMETNSDGIEAALEVRKTLNIPVIFLTALTDGPTIDKAKMSLPYGYVVKPFNEAELLSNLEVAIHKSGVEKELLKSSELFKAILEQIKSYIILVDFDGKIRYFNKNVESLIKKPFEEINKKKIGKILSFSNSEQKISFHDLKERDDINNLELQLYGGTQESIFGDFRIEAIYVNGKENYLFVFSDISERVSARIETQELKKKQVSILIEGQEKERVRIAREIHDGIGQIANIIKLTAKKENASSELVGMIDYFLEEVRKITRGLHPSILTDFPVEICLKRMIEQIDKNSTINFTYNDQDLPEELPMKVKVNIYRIVQECVSNILKHSKANNANIQLYGYPKHLSLTVEDDGVGFDINDTSNQEMNYGMQNLKFRCEMINAEFILDSSLNNGGAFLNFIIPYKENSINNDIFDEEDEWDGSLNFIDINGQT